MKKFLSLIVAVVISFSLKAQVSLTTAVDFTAQDFNGNEISLFEILENGQYVLLHFNTRTNEATPEITPSLVEAYTQLGCNQHDVFFVCIYPNGKPTTTQKWIDEYGIEYPIIHNTEESNGMEGPAIDIWMKYYCELPTTALIAPDKSIALNDITPMKTAQNIIDALSAFGIEQHECGEENTDGNEELVNNTFNIYPNPASSELNITSATSGEATISVYDMTGRCVKNVVVNDISNATININDINKGIYFIDINGEVEKLIVK